MTASPSGCDYVITENAEAELQALDLYDHFRVQRVLDDLLVDPTVRRPTVSEQTGRQPGEPQFRIQVRDVAIYFDMANLYVAIVRSVRILR